MDHKSVIAEKSSQVTLYHPTDLFCDFIFSNERWKEQGKNLPTSLSSILQMHIYFGIRYFLKNHIGAGFIPLLTTNTVIQPNTTVMHYTPACTWCGLGKKLSNTHKHT